MAQGNFKSKAKAASPKTQKPLKKGGECPPLDFRASLIKLQKARTIAPVRAAARADQKRKSTGSQATNHIEAMMAERAERKGSLRVVKPSTAASSSSKPKTEKKT
jgi:hypothetical protein